MANVYKKIKHVVEKYHGKTVKHKKEITCAVIPDCTV